MSDECIAACVLFVSLVIAIGLVGHYVVQHEAQHVAAVIACMKLGKSPADCKILAPP